MKLVPSYLASNFPDTNAVEMANHRRRLLRRAVYILSYEEAGKSHIFVGSFADLSQTMAAHARRHQLECLSERAETARRNWAMYICTKEEVGACTIESATTLALRLTAG
jgi:hypothetical protein